MGLIISYFVHGTTEDNLMHLASGQNDVFLSALGVEQGIELGKVRKDNFDVIFTSDLSRAYNTAKLAWKDKFEIIQDKRLRECDYGELTQKKKTWDIVDFVKDPYSNGESYFDVEKRMRSFLVEVKEKYNNKHVAFVAHQAPQLALEVITKNKSWEQAIKEDWRNTKNWKPGWEYSFD